MNVDLLTLILIALLAASVPAFNLYMLAFEGVTYVRHVGWRTYEEAPFGFWFGGVLCSLLLLGIAAFFVIIVYVGRSRQ